MTNPRLDIDGRDLEGGGSQLLLAVVAAAVVLLIGLLLALVTAPGEIAPSAPETPVTSSAPVLELADQIG